MALVVLLILGIVWVLFVGTKVIRWRRERSSSDAGTFREQLGALRRAWRVPGDDAGSTPMSLSAAQRRRREVLGILAGIAATTLAVWLVSGSGLLLVLHLAADATVAGYVALCVRARALAAEREEKVRYLPVAGDHDPEPIDDERAVQLTASGS